jgi:hypothetical protein
MQDYGCGRPSCLACVFQDGPGFRAHVKDTYSVLGTACEAQDWLIVRVGSELFWLDHRLENMHQEVARMRAESERLKDLNQQMRAK